MQLTHERLPHRSVFCGTFLRKKQHVHCEVIIGTEHSSENSSLQQRMLLRPETSCLYKILLQKKYPSIQGETSVQETRVAP